MCGIGNCLANNCVRYICVVILKHIHSLSSRFDRNLIECGDNCYLRDFLCLCMSFGIFRCGSIAKNQQKTKCNILILYDSRFISCWFLCASSSVCGFVLLVKTVVDKKTKRPVVKEKPSSEVFGYDTHNRNRAERDEEDPFTLRPDPWKLKT